MRWNPGLSYWIIKSKLEEMALKENIPFQLSQLFKEHLFLIILIPLLKNKTKNYLIYTSHFPLILLLALPLLF